MEKFPTEDIYHIPKWGLGHYSINREGHLCANTIPINSPDFRRSGQQIDIVKVLTEIKKKKISFPIVLRFHDILRYRVKELFTTFDRIINEYNYQGKYRGVYPIKVNQVREVVEEIVDAGREYHLGLEAGSKTELMAILTQELSPEAVIIVNGYKDEQTIRLALLGRQLNKNIFLVIEKFSELETIIKLSKELEITPLIGIRIKLTTKGSGRWSSSTGRHAKFGLTISELLKSVELLKEHKLLSSFQLLHFHIGSQIPDIRIFKEALTEFSRIYCNLRKMEVPIKNLDIGGGLGINYDGAHNNLQSSVNYGLKDYVENVVYIIQQICDLEQIEHPNIISESGRALSAHHSCIITNVFGEKSTRLVEDHQRNLEKLQGQKKHILLENMLELYTELNHSNCLESYHDCCQIKTDSYNAFKLGLLSLEEWSEIETLYNLILQTIDLYNAEELQNSSEMLAIKKELSAQYLCNFSVFQSTADCWAIDQILPIVPLQRLDEIPTNDVTLVDITCDSDGKIKHYLNSSGGNDPLETLKLHKLRNEEDYYIGIFLTGAYQDIMGDMHNLFGRVNEVHIYADDEEPDGFYIEEVIAGNRSSEILQTMQYEPKVMARSIKKQLDRLIKQKAIKSKKGIELIDFYEECLNKYTYLD